MENMESKDSFVGKNDGSPENEIIMVRAANTHDSSNIGSSAILPSS